jgi:flagellar hook protein FlgE
VDISAIALQGLQQAESQFARAASQLSSAGVAPDGGAGDMVDLSAAAVALISAKDDYASNLATVKIADEMERDTVNLLA